MSKKKKSTKRVWIEYGVIAAVGLILYLTGLHTEVIGFAQRGLLKTGLMNPKVERVSVGNNTDPARITADLDIELINSRGERVNMSQFRGKAIFMNIWATWCPPCIAEMPSIQKLYSQVREENVEFIMLSVDDDFEKAKAYRERKGYDFEIYTLAGPLPSTYQTSSIPTTFIIGANQELALTHKGMSDYGTKKFRNFFLGLQ